MLWRGPTQVQIGTDPRWAVVLADLDPSAARALHRAGPGARLDALRAAFREDGVAQQEVDAVVAHLQAARLLVPAGSPSDTPEGIAAGLLSADGDGSAVVQRRSRALVRVEGLGRLGTALCLALAGAGVGALQLRDERAVTRHDLALGGLGPSDVGTTRSAAVLRVLREVAPQVRTSTVAARRPDVVVVVEAGAADPVRYTALRDDDLVHLSVVLREASVLIGPLVVPGRSACLRCLDLWRAGQDEGWPAVAAQLVATAQTSRAGQDATLASVGAATAAAQVVAHVDGRVTQLHDATVELRLPDAWPRRTPWAVHPACGCAGIGAPA